MRRGLFAPLSVFHLLLQEQLAEATETWWILVKLYETSFGEKRIFSSSIVFTWQPFVHECSANFRSFFLPILMVFSQNYQKSQIFRYKFWFIVILNISLPFWFKILSGGGNFLFSANFGLFSWVHLKYDGISPDLTQFSMGAILAPYSFSLISPERLELRPSNFLTFSFYLLAIRKI